MTNPIDNFKKNWQEAKSLKDANAHYCTLATVSKIGQPSMRTIVLREVTEDSFVLFINNSSPKWQELELSGQWELMVFWPSLMQQYRIQGEFSQIPLAIMKQHWANKPYDSKIIDHYYDRNQSQSSVISSRNELQEDIDKLKQEYPSEAEIPFPSNAIGIYFKADFVEEWIGVIEDRLHKRYQYLLHNDEWQKSILVP